MALQEKPKKYNQKDWQRKKMVEKTLAQGKQPKPCPICKVLLPPINNSLGVHVAHEHPGQKVCCHCWTILTEENKVKVGRRHVLCKNCAHMQRLLRYQQHKEREQKRSLLKRRAVRQRIIDVLGGKCVRCGFDNPLALQIDHVQNNGHAEKKRFGCYGERYIRYVLKQILAGSTDYQLLCANCNQIKILRRVV